MTEPTTTVVAELPVKPSALKRWTKRTLIAAAAVGVVAAVYARVNSSDEETVNTEPTPAS